MKNSDQFLDILLHHCNKKIKWKISKLLLRV